MIQTDLRYLAIQYLRGLENSGISDLPCLSEEQLAGSGRQLPQLQNPVAVSETAAPYVSNASKPATNSPVAARQPAKVATAASTTINDPYGVNLDEASRIDALKVLSETVSQCTRCDELSRCRKQTVFGVGNPQPRLAFYGEGPGAEEDRLGEPFVGAAGELLNKILTASKMNREDVYIFNTVKCRPPGNRNPHDTEIDNCWSYSEQQLEILQPEFICCLGSVAARTLLKTKESVGRLRGRFHEYRGSKVLVTYHPAYLLRTPAAKAKTWDDMKMLLRAMDIEF